MLLLTSVTWLRSLAGLLCSQSYSPRSFPLFFWKEVTMHSLHGRSGGLCTTTLRVEYLQKLLTILVHVSITFLRFYFY